MKKKNFESEKLKKKNEKRRKTSIKRRNRFFFLFFFLYFIIFNITQSDHGLIGQDELDIILNSDYECLNLEIYESKKLDFKNLVIPTFRKKNVRMKIHHLTDQNIKNIFEKKETKTLTLVNFFFKKKKINNKKKKRETV